MRPIDADALDVEQINCCYGDHCRTEDVQEWLDEAPTLDYAPVRHGEWIKTRKHLWKKDDDGEVDEWGWESGYHNGPYCTICHASPCVHCKPDYDEEESCREHYMCSECGRIVLDLEPYCHCGAKMDAKEAD